MDHNYSEDLDTGVRVLVTGANGFIATHIIQQLQQQGYKVRGTVREITSDAKISPLRDLCHDSVYPLDLYEANLTDEFHWENAVEGCMYVIHIANPVPSRIPDDEELEVIRPTLDGLINVLRACQRSRCVKRVVFTSSVGAISNGFQGDPGKVYTEEDWTDPAKAALWERTKTLAEKAAWDFIESIPRFDRFELTVVHPSVVMGPVLCGKYPHSMEIPKRMLERSITVLPKICFPIVDVRDVAEAHIQAMLCQKAAFKRIIISNCNIWVSDVAKIMEGEFDSQGYKIPTTSASWFMLWVKSFCDEKTKLMMPALGKEVTYDNTRMRELLDVQPRPVKETILDMCYSLVDLGFVSKKRGYKGKTEKGKNIETSDGEPGSTEVKEEHKTPKEILEEEKSVDVMERNADSYIYRDSNLVDAAGDQTTQKDNRDRDAEKEYYIQEEKAIVREEEKEIETERDNGFKVHEDIKIEKELKLANESEPEVPPACVQNYVHAMDQDQAAENELIMQQAQASNLETSLPEVNNHISDQQAESNHGLDNVLLSEHEPPERHVHNYTFVQEENGELVLESTFQTYAEESTLSIHDMPSQEEPQKFVEYTYTSETGRVSTHTQV